MSELMDLFHDMSQLHAELAQPARFARGFQPSADIWEEESGYHIELDVPGMTRDSLQLEIDNNVLTVTGERQRPARAPKQYYAERRCGPYRRTFRLPQGVDVGSIEAQLRAGVLSVTLPKRAEVRPRSIDIRVADDAARALEATVDGDAEAA